MCAGQVRLSSRHAKEVKPGEGVASPQQNRIHDPAQDITSLLRTGWEEEQGGERGTMPVSPNKATLEPRGSTLPPG